MSLVEFAIATQTSGRTATTSNPTYSTYLVIVLLALVAGLVLLVFIRTSARGSKR
jgi:hypothetical protein